MSQQSELASRIAVIMTSVWTPVPVIKRSEIERLANEVAVKLQRRESPKAIEDYLARAQDALWIESKEAYRRIAYRASQLV